MTPVWIMSPDAQTTRHIIIVIIIEESSSAHSTPTRRYTIGRQTGMTSSKRFAANRRTCATSAQERQTHANDLWIESYVERETVGEARGNGSRVASWSMAAGDPVWGADGADHLPDLRSRRLRKPIHRAEPASRSGRQLTRRDGHHARESAARHRRLATEP